MTVGNAAASAVVPVLHYILDCLEHLGPRMAAFCSRYIFNQKSSFIECLKETRHVDCTVTYDRLNILHNRFNVVSNMRGDKGYCIFIWHTPSYNVINDKTVLRYELYHNNQASYEVPSPNPKSLLTGSYHPRLH